MVSKNPKRKNLPSLDDLLKEIKADAKKNPPPQQKPKKLKIPPPPLKPASKPKNCLDCCDDMLGMLSIINDSASKILDALKAEKLLDKKTAERIKKEQEERERRERENLLESSGRKLTGTFRKAVAPLQNALDSIFKFILFTLAGRVIGKIVKWFSDPANEKKIKTLSRFLSNWWPAILSAFVIFGTRFGGAIRATVKMAVSTILHLKKIAIPGILLALKKFGKTGLIVGGAVGGIALISKLLSPKDEETKNQNTTTPEPKNDYSRAKPPVAMKSGGIVPHINLSLPNSTPVNDIRFAEGGHIREDSGISITGAGPDTQLIAAQPGEIIISKAAVDKFGADTFLRMNLMAGSTNKPKFANNIQFAVQGGMIGKNYQSNVTMPEMSINANIEKPQAFPKIQKSDYNMILALSTAEGTTPQYRAERAGEIYNQMQSKSFSKTIISDYIKTNKLNFNVGEISKIRDRRSAAVFVAKEKNIGIQPALMLLRQTEDHIRSNKPKMAPLDSKMNRASVAKPMPTPNVNRNTFYQPDRAFSSIKPFNASQNYESQISPIKSSISIPGPRPKSEINISELPPIDIRKGTHSPNMPAHTDVPDFPLIPKISDRYGENGTLSLYEIEL